MRNQSYQCNLESYMVSRIFTTDIHQRSYTTLCYGVVSRRVQFGSHWVSVQNRMQNKYVYDLCSGCSILRLFVFTLRLRYIHTWWTMIILITGKTRRPANSVPCWDQDGACSGIPGLYLWYLPSLWYIDYRHITYTALIFSSIVSIVYNQIYDWSNLPNVDEKWNNYPDSSRSVTGTSPTWFIW